MKNIFSNFLILIVTISILISCNTNPADKFQGVFEVDKELLKRNLQLKTEGENSITNSLLNVAVDNALIEFCIKGDSITGILSMAGETTLLESKFIVINDSLKLYTPDAIAKIVPTEKGISYRAIGSNMTIILNKTNRTDLSLETKKAIEIQKEVIKEKERFEQTLGKWQTGNYVDDFGDETGNRYAYCLIRGTNENSITSNNEVYVKVMVQSGKLLFDIYNSSLSMKETLPDGKYGKSGKMKLKFPDGKVQTASIFFFQNTIVESGDKAILFDYISKNDGLVKVFIDLSTASEYYSDKYQFAIERSNLTEILEGLK